MGRATAVNRCLHLGDTVCWRSSSFGALPNRLFIRAMQTEYSLSYVTYLCSHRICGPRFLRNTASF